nr:MAG: hypothetical protein 3 [Hangzhou hepe-like virus 1]
MSISLNQTTLSNIINLFSCSITKEIAYEPVTTPCNHLFDTPAITEWLENNRSCPVCRCYLHPNQLSTSHIARGFVSMFNLHRTLNEATTNQQVETSTQTDDQSDIPAGPRDSNHQDESDNSDQDDVPELVPVFQPCTSPRSPIIGHGFRTLSVSDLPTDVEIPRDSRLVDFNVELTNPASHTNFDLILDNNIAFLTRVGARFHQHPHGFIMRYVYQSELDLYDTMEHLSRQGYYIYDIALIENRPRLSRYLLYSLPRMANGLPVRLSQFIRGSPWLTSRQRN